MNGAPLQRGVDRDKLKAMLRQKRRMRYFLSFCASCGLCAESCFYYRKHGDPRSTPAYKAVNTLGVMFSRKRTLSRDDLEGMKDLLWGKCVLCRRCYCPFGIDISGMISWARSICRAQGIYEDYRKSSRGL